MCGVVQELPHRIWTLTSDIVENGRAMDENHGGRVVHLLLLLCVTTARRQCGAAAAAAVG